MKSSGKKPEFCVLSCLLALILPVSIYGQGGPPYSGIYEALQAAAVDHGSDVAIIAALDSMFDGAPRAGKVLYAQKCPYAEPVAAVKIERVSLMGLESSAGISPAVPLLPEIKGTPSAAEPVDQALKYLKGTAAGKEILNTIGGLPVAIEYKLGAASELNGGAARAVFKYSFWGGKVKSVVIYVDPYAVSPKENDTANLAILLAHELGHVEDVYNFAPSRSDLDGRNAFLNIERKAILNTLAVFAEHALFLSDDMPADLYVTAMRYWAWKAAKSYVPFDLSCIQPRYRKLWDDYVGYARSCDSLEAYFERILKHTGSYGAEISVMKTSREDEIIGWKISLSAAARLQKTMNSYIHMYDWSPQPGREHFDATGDNPVSAQTAPGQGQIPAQQNPSNSGSQHHGWSAGGGSVPSIPGWAQNPNWSGKL